MSRDCSTSCFLFWGLSQSKFWGLLDGHWNDGTEPSPLKTPKKGDPCCEGRQKIVNDSVLPSGNILRKRFESHHQFRWGWIITP